MRNLESSDILHNKHAPSSKTITHRWPCRDAVGAFLETTNHWTEWTTEWSKPVHIVRSLTHSPKRSFVQNGSNTSLTCDVATACWRLAWDDKHLTFSLQIHLDALFDLSWFLTVQYAPERLTPFVPHWFNVRITKDNISKLLEQWRICMFKSKVNNLRSLICSRRDTRRKQYFCPKNKNSIFLKELKITPRHQNKMLGGSSRDLDYFTYKISLLHWRMHNLSCLLYTSPSPRDA